MVFLDGAHALELRLFFQETGFSFQQLARADRRVYCTGLASPGVRLHLTECVT